MKKYLYSNKANALKAANEIAKLINGTVELASCDDIYNCECMDAGAEKLCNGGVSGETEAYRVYDEDFNIVDVMAFWEVDEEENEEVEKVYESWIEGFEEVCEKNNLNVWVDDSKDYYRLFVDGELAYDDSACEDLYDEIGALTVFATYLDDRFFDGKNTINAGIQKLTFRAI